MMAGSIIRGLVLIPTTSHCYNIHQRTSAGNNVRPGKFVAELFHVDGYWKVSRMVTTPNQCHQFDSISTALHMLETHS